MATPQTIDIIPGFAEGSWHTRRLMKALEPYGYIQAPSSAEADIVITHSAGCFFLPNTAENTRIILINPPYWPGKPILVSVFQKTVGDFVGAVRRHHLGFWAHKTAWNLLYIALNLLRVYRIAQFARQQNFHEALRGKHVAIIRNDNDPWFTPHAAELLPKDEDFQYYHLPGEHEDCWYYTAEHAALIQKILRET
jgi:hypothetical protein